MPDMTRVEQNSWQEALFDRALLRRTALVAPGANPEVLGYQSFVKILYKVLAMFFWPLAPIVLLVVVVTAMSSTRYAHESTLIAFFISVMMIDLISRLSFYSIVDWILWGILFRYLLGASVLSVLIVTTLLSAWAAPAIGVALRPRMTKLPGQWFWAEIGERPDRRA